MNRPIVPCLWLDDQAEQAATFYTKTFPNGRVLFQSRYPETADNPSGKPRGSVLTVEIELAGQRFTLLNGGPMFTINPSISFFVNVATAAEVDRLFGVLAEGGQALMPLNAYPWSPRYAWVKDRFGVSWQLMTGAEMGATIVPCLMFAGANHGRASEAIAHYTAIFPRSKTDVIDRYVAGEPVEGVKHGRFVLDGQTMVAMDSGTTHGFGFDEGLSLQVMCENQAEIDRYWSALGAGGSPGPCGWLKDRFGVSWQVVPKDMAQVLTSPNTAARDRAFGAVMKMGKLDIAQIQAAFDGR